MKAYRIILVSPTDVENGAVKDSVVFLHSQNREQPNLFFFVTHPESLDGIPLTMSQVVRCPECDVDEEEPGTESEDSIGTHTEVQQDERRFTVADAAAAIAAADTGGGMKFDDGKPQPMLLFGGMPLALQGISAVLGFGAEKYAPNSWRTVPNGLARYKDALMRHMLAYFAGEWSDPESGLPHLDHAATNLAFIRELEAQENNKV